ncbi:MAG: GMC family oxidoreductase N-terminal domain-containing protein [Caulobacteraceae bacterium]|nr:GMC family oxidoreductase N-terminal domain-containing protein [Caulobacteraceae bacterium]
MIDKARDQFDYVIVGAGSSGSALAHRLSQDPALQVLLIESGPPDRNPLIRMPRGYARVIGDPAYSWTYPVKRAGGLNEPETHVRGRTLGGSSAVNGMVYMRGLPEDYDSWSIPGWGWKDFLAAFRQIERHEFGADDTRGGDGPLRISARPLRLPLIDAVLAAGEELGAPTRRDINAQSGEGLGYTVRNIWRGRRQSAAEAFLKPIRGRRTLHILTNATVDRIAFEGRRATGVVIRGAEGARLVRAGREVVLAAGAIGTPKLLHLSGVGPGERLRSFGLPVILDAPEVGRNLSDHRVLSMKFRVTGGSHNLEFSGWRLYRNVLQQTLLGGGPMSHPAFEAGGYVRTEPGLASPDARLLIGPFTVDGSARRLSMEREPGLTIGGYQMRPQSRGYIELASPDPDAAPIIHTNALSHPEDVRSSIGMVRYIRRLAAARALAPYAPREIAIGEERTSDEAILDAWNRQSGSGMHISGTCRMGSDAQSVVDTQLRVRGLEGLRIVDISVLPDVISGNTNAPAMALGWMAAAVIAQAPIAAAQAA